jgi:hypothetical protein
MTFWDFSGIFTTKRRNLFLDSNFPKSYLLPIRGYSCHKNEIKRIRSGCYSSNNFQDSTKEKLLKENIGYLLRVLFFNAFELGVVILRRCSYKRRKELEARESIKKQIRNKFKSKPLPIKKSLVKKQVLKAQSNKHTKAKQVQLQEFQHKEGKLNITDMHKTMFPSLIITFSSIMNRINNITIT